jgi:biopolymer transport protein TolQ
MSGSLELTITERTAPLSESVTRAVAVLPVEPAGVSQARLILFAAIPAVLAFNHYTGKGETVYSDRALFAEEMVALLQRQSLGETKEHD